MTGLFKNLSLKNKIETKKKQKIKKYLENLQIGL
jgi:hypothetical protein